MPPAMRGDLVYSRRFVTAAQSMPCVSGGGLEKNRGARAGGGMRRTAARGKGYGNRNATTSSA